MVPAEEKENFDKFLSNENKLRETIRSKNETEILKSTSPLVSIWRKYGKRKEMIRLRDKFHVSDSLDHIVEKLEEIFTPSYCPSREDILRVRLPTTGIEQKRIWIKNKKFVFKDVGGQRRERNKWIESLTGVTGNNVIFFASLAEYNQLCEEDNQQNRLRESGKPVISHKV